MVDKKNLLCKLQSEIKCPKKQYNSFSKFYYRSLEDIFKSASAVLAQEQASLVISDEIVLIGDRYYIKATAKIVGADGVVLAETCGWAREEETKKGADSAQITGMASSYARKYALNAMFLLSDEEDLDSQKQEDETAKEPILTEYRYNLSKMEDVAKRKKSIDYFISKGAKIEVIDSETIVIVSEEIEKLKDYLVKGE